MDLPRFEDFSIAGMAVMYTTNYTFDITKLFPLIPVAWERLDAASEGDIISVKFGEFQRGCRSISSGCMKNMIMLRMKSANGSNISIKFNSDKIHICGTKDYETPRYICTTLLRTLDTLYDTLTFIQNNKQLYSDIIHEALDNIDRVSDVRDDPGGEGVVYKLMVESLDKLNISDTDQITEDQCEPLRYISALNSLKNKYDPLVIEFITNQVYDYVNNSYGTDTHGYLNQVLNLADNVDLIDVPDKFEIIREDTNMLNYNYDMSDILGKPVRLVKYNVLESLMPIRNCVIHSDNRLKQNITLHILSHDGYIHRIIINRNGKIIHSSHDQQSMSNIYRQLMTLLIENNCTEDVDLYKQHHYNLDKLFA